MDRPRTARLLSAVEHIGNSRQLKQGYAEERSSGCHRD